MIEIMGGYPKIGFRPCGPWSSAAGRGQAALSAPYSPC